MVTILVSSQSGQLPNAPELVSETVIFQSDREIRLLSKSSSYEIHSKKSFREFSRIVAEWVRIIDLESIDIISLFMSVKNNEMKSEAGP